MKKVLILLSFITLATASMAQRRENQMWFKHAVGFRYELLQSGMCGLSYERFWTTHSSFEIIGVGYFAEGLEVAGFYKYTSIFPGLSPQFRWFGGGGVHIASWFDKKPKDPFVPGIDAIVGLGFVFHKLPIGISVDWRPTIDFYSQDPEKREDPLKLFSPEKLGITFRYTMRQQ
ncbi:MAG: hypothetical protein LBR55_06585 [Bacteroidales bacterium]|jgi:hypothetical protein|nr:hypothetical protein [Bacteroidales bacterium]